MNIDLPSIADQQALIFEEGTKDAIALLRENLRAPRLPHQTQVNENNYPRTHLLREHEGWEPPDPAIVTAYFRHFQSHFRQYDTDAKLAALLGLSGDRRVRAFREGSKPVPYNVWRTFLVITGRVPQEAIRVLAFMG